MEGAGPRGVVRADFLADVASDEAVSEGAVEGGVDGLASLDGEVRDAAGSIDVVGGDRGGRAGVDATGARAAAIGEGWRGWPEVEGGEEASQDEPTTEVGVDEERVLADPPEAGALGEFPLGDRGGVGEDSSEGGWEAGAKFVGEGVEAACDDAVVVASAGIAGHAGVPGGEGRIDVATRGVEIGDHDGGSRAWEEACGIESLLEGFGEPGHGGVFAAADPVSEGGLTIGAVGGGDAGGCEPEFEAAGHDLAREGGHGQAVAGAPTQL